MSAFQVFNIHIELGNEAMSTQQDIARALRRVARELDESVPAMDSYIAGNIRDANGNTVGGFSITDHS